LLFAVGVATTVAVLVAWATNLVAKPAATVFGGTLTATMMLGGLAYRRGMWRPRAAPSVTPEEAERIAAERPAAAEILTLAEAIELAPAYRPLTLVCVRTRNERLSRRPLPSRGPQGGGRRGAFIDEVPGLVPRDTEPRASPRRLEGSVAWLNARAPPPSRSGASRATRRRTPTPPPGSASTPS
jgi:hypothetical protein